MCPNCIIHSVCLIIWMDVQESIQDTINNVNISQRQSSCLTRQRIQRAGHRCCTQKCVGLHHVFKPTSHSSTTLHNTRTHLAHCKVETSQAVPAQITLLWYDTQRSACIEKVTTARLIKCRKPQREKTGKIKKKQICWEDIVQIIVCGVSPEGGRVYSGKGLWNR